MASNFDRWEKDPFFSAAEEVQQSADRMESTYRAWVHSTKDLSGLWSPKELGRDLRTAFGTTKWQLDEFERAVKLSHTNSSVDDARDRHHEFIVAIRSQISRVEHCLHESTVSAGKPPRPWVQLNEGECNELAMFLSGSSASAGKNLRNSSEIEKKAPPACLKSSSHLGASDSPETSEKKLPGHRRVASANADIGAWEIAVADDVFPHVSPNVKHNSIPRKVPSFSGFLNTLGSTKKFNWSKNGYRKLKVMDCHEDANTSTSQTQNLNRGIHACYERNRSCLNGCDDCYDKHLYGWYGAIQRQLQRSQYQMLYNRPAQFFLWISLIFFLLVIFGICVI